MTDLKELFKQYEAQIIDVLDRAETPMRRLFALKIVADEMGSEDRGSECAGCQEANTIYRRIIEHELSSVYGEQN